MPVPSGNSHLKNTANGAFTAQTQGGTVLGNTTTGDVITKASALKDNATAPQDGPGPKAKANGLVANQKVLSGGTFAYSSAGNYVIRTISTTLSGVASTKVLIPGSEGARVAVHEFLKEKGADTTSLIRKGRFSRTGYFNNGNKISSRSLFMNAAGTASAAPTALNKYMWDLADGNATNQAQDDAIPTRAIPGELVMKADFVTLGVSGGDHFDYKAITGM
tara:strand:- start:299 stop:958 length:660 start_codon:yes stop_codon:yes gene_type:complete